MRPWSRLASGIEEAREERRRFAPAGQSTQMIVGADDATDEAVLARSASLYGRRQLRRVYYSAFSPIPRGPRGFEPPACQGAAVEAREPALSGRLAASFLWLFGSGDRRGRRKTACWIAMSIPSWPGR